MSQTAANEDRKITDELRQSSFASIFEAFVWLNGKDWLNGNTFNYYWEARSACTAWRGLSSNKAPWTQTSLRQPVNLNDSLRWTKLKKERNCMIHLWIMNEPTVVSTWDSEFSRFCDSLRSCYMYLIPVLDWSQFVYWDRYRCSLIWHHLSQS